MLSAPTETEQLHKDIFFLFFLFFPPPKQSHLCVFFQIVFLLLCLPSMHVTPKTSPSLTRSDHIAFRTKTRTEKGNQEKKTTTMQ